MNQTIIGPAPYAIQVEWRWGDSVNHAATMRLLGRVGFVFSDALRKVVLRSRQIGADLLPVNASVARFPERVSRKKKQMQINWRKDHWLRAHHPEILCWHGHRQNRLRLTGSSIKPRQFAADEDVRIERIGDHVTVFLRRDRLPVTEGDFPIVATTCDPDRTAFLLTTV